MRKFLVISYYDGNIGIDVVIVERYEDIVEEIKLQDLSELSKLDLILIIERFINSI